MAELDRQEHRLLDAYQSELVDFDQFRQRQGRPRQRRAHVKGSIDVLHTERTTAQQQAQLQADLETFVDRIRGPLATLAFDARQKLVRTVLERVMVEDSRVDIHFVIPLPDPPRETTNSSVSAHFQLRSNGNERLWMLQNAPRRRGRRACRDADGRVRCLSLRTFKTAGGTPSGDRRQIASGSQGQSDCASVRTVGGAAQAGAASALANQFGVEP